MKFRIRANNATSHAEMEFKALGYEPISKLSSDDPNRWIQENIFELLAVFRKQGHSGFSAPFCIDYFSKLANFEPLSPLTGEAWEWVDVSESSGYPLWQNARCSHVFKDETGSYDIDAKVFREPSGACYTNRESRANVAFPYTPKREYIDVPYLASKIYDLPRLGHAVLARLRHNSKSSFRIYGGLEKS